MVGVSKTTVLKLLVEVGELCSIYQYHKLRNLPCKRIQADEIWAFVGAKQRHAKRLAEEFGVVSIAELTDYADRAPMSVAGIVTSLHVRTTKRAEQLAWVVLSDRAGGLECAVSGYGCKLPTPRTW